MPVVSSGITHMPRVCCVGMLERLCQAVRAGRWGLCSDTLIRSPVVLLSLAIKQQHSRGRELTWAVWVIDGIEGERKAKQCFPAWFVGQR